MIFYLKLIINWILNIDPSVIETKFDSMTADLQKMTFSFMSVEVKTKEVTTVAESSAI